MFNGKSLWLTHSSVESVCVQFSCRLVNLIDCTGTTWAFDSHYDFDECFTNRKA